MHILTIYTDGSCNNKTGIGGVGVYMEYGQHTFTFSKGYEGTTSARMEIQAVIHALELIKNKDKYLIHIYCDNQYVVNTIAKGWMFDWERLQFIGKKNSDLWKRVLNLHREFKPNTIKVFWVRGHNKGQTPGNEIADRLANSAYQAIRDKVTN